MPDPSRPTHDSPPRPAWLDSVVNRDASQPAIKAAPAWRATPVPLAAETAQDAAGSTIGIGPLPTPSPDRDRGSCDDSGRFLGVTKTGGQPLGEKTGL